MGYTHCADTKICIRVNDSYVEPLDNSYWLGRPMLNVLPDGACELLIDYRISLSEFMNTRHIEWYEIMQVKYVPVDGTQFVSYHAIIKTFWLREFQRLWKRRTHLRSPTERHLVR